jgi:hypothetical protein
MAIFPAHPRGRTTQHGEGRVFFPRTCMCRCHSAVSSFICRVPEPVVEDMDTLACYNLTLDSFFVSKMASCSSVTLAKVWHLTLSLYRRWQVVVRLRRALFFISGRTCSKVCFCHCRCLLLSPFVKQLSVQLKMQTFRALRNYSKVHMLTAPKKIQDSIIKMLTCKLCLGKFLDVVLDHFAVH